MTKKKLDLLGEVKRKSIKIMTLCKKIEESDKLGMDHRHDEYLEQLSIAKDQLNDLHVELQKQ